MGAFNGRGRVFREFLIPAVLFVLLCPVLCAQTTETLSRTFHFEKPVVKEVHADGASFASVRMKSTISLGRHAGEPALPVRCVKFLLPPGRQVTAIEVKGVLSDFETAGVDLTTSPVFPHQPPLPLGKKAASRPNGLAFDEKLYASSRPFPAEDFSGPKTGVCRGYTIYSMNLHPVKYVPAAGLLLRQQEMTVKLTLENRSTQSPLFRNSPADKVWVKRLVCNPESAAEYEEAGGHGNVSGGRTGPGYPGGLCDPADQYDYVILTTTQNGLDHWSTGGSTPYNWQSLMDRHAVDGLACTLVTLEQILAEPDYENPDPLFDDAPARIREFARDAYLDWGIQYLLVERCGFRRLLEPPRRHLQRRP
ncbi:MAG: C25 family peptidase propeptide domain-containing protein [Planctomycetota bacterium]|jgi:hypothetical protein